MTITEHSEGVIKLSDSPIIFTIQVDAISDLFADYSHYCATVEVNHGSDRVSYIEIPCDNSAFTIDISSSIIGYFIGKKYDCSTLAKLKASVSAETFTVTFNYKCKKKEKSNGHVSVYTGTNPITKTIQTVDGGLTEYAIYNHDAINRDSFKDTFKYSLKPFSMETVNKEEQPYPSTGRPYFQESFTNYRRKRFWFINSLGTLESASLMMREEMDIKYDSTTHKLYKEASFAYSPNISTSKTDATSWKMSSGYCAKDWREWFASEFAFAKHFWMELTDGTLIPVSINVDNLQAYDKSKGTLGSVNFTVNYAL